MSKRGRKDKYKTHVLPNLSKIKQWMINKCTDEFIADSLLLGYSTWMKYKSEKKELKELQEETIKSRAVLAEDIRQALIDRAKGFDYEESKTIIVTGENGEPKIQRKEVYKKKALADPTAAREVLFFLGDKETSNRATFELKMQELAFKKEQARAEEEWVIGGEENE